MSERIVDIVQPNDPEINGLVSVEQVAHYWKAEEGFVRRRLREHGVHFLQVPRPLMVRWSDVEEFERAHTLILGEKSDRKLLRERRKRKEVLTIS
jgi:hypothetical protein